MGLRWSRHQRVGKSVAPQLTQRVLEAAPVVILLLDGQGAIQYANPYFERMTGYRLDEIQGKDWFDTFLPVRDRERIRAVFRRSYGGVSVRGNVNPIVTRTGEEREIEWTDEQLRYSVPPRGSASTARRPPSRRARSRMLRRPWWPSSTTGGPWAATVVGHDEVELVGPEHRRDAHACEAPAWRAVFESASRRICSRCWPTSSGAARPGAEALRPKRTSRPVSSAKRRVSAPRPAAMPSGVAGGSASARM